VACRLIYADTAEGKEVTEENLDLVFL